MKPALKTILDNLDILSPDSLVESVHFALKEGHSVSCNDSLRPDGDTIHVYSHSFKGSGQERMNWSPISRSEIVSACVSFTKKAIDAGIVDTATLREYRKWNS